MERLISLAQTKESKNQAQKAEAVWEELEQLINETDDNFVQKLRQEHPDFKEKDIYLCMLVRLKVTNATIESIFRIGESAVKKRKSTLKKTGFHIDDPNIMLDQVVSEI